MKILGYFISKRDEIALLKEAVNSAKAENVKINDYYLGAERRFASKRRSAALRALSLTEDEVIDALAVHENHPVYKALVCMLDQRVEEQVTDLGKPTNIGQDKAAFLQGGLNALRDLRDSLERVRSDAYNASMGEPTEKDRKPPVIK